MNKTSEQVPSFELVDSMLFALNELSQLNDGLYQYWMELLYDEDGDEVWEEWYDRSLELMQHDVMQFASDCV